MDRLKDPDLQSPLNNPVTSSNPVPSSAAPQEPVDSLASGASTNGADPLPSRPNTGDRREVRLDRRGGDRRDGSLRRGRDRQRNVAANKLAYVGTVLCTLSAGLGIYAFLRAPITFSPSPACNEGFGGQRIEHRGLSMLWSIVMVLAAAGLAIPDRKRRPVLLMVLCGVSIGLFVGAYFTVGTKLVGFCID